MASLKLALHFQPYWWQMETGNKKTKTECLKNILHDNRIHQTHKSRILSEWVAITWHKLALGASRAGELLFWSREHCLWHRTPNIQTLLDMSGVWIQSHSTVIEYVETACRQDVSNSCFFNVLKGETSNQSRNFKHSKCKW